MQDFRRLHVWQKAHALVLAADKALPARACRATPWLRQQILRAAASVSANIAEGCGKRTTREFLRFIEIALGSSRELENHLLLARDLGMLTVSVVRELEALTKEVRRMLVGLSNALHRQPEKA